MQKETPSLWKRTPLIAVAAAVALLIAGVLLALNSESNYRRAKADDLEVQANILASSASAALAFDDPKTASGYLNALSANPDIQAAAIYDSDGALFAGYLRGSNALSSAQIRAHAPAYANGKLDVAVPVSAGGSVIGTVYLSATADPLERRLARYGVFALLVVMASLVVTVLGIAQGALAGANQKLEQTNDDLRSQIAEREKAEDALRQSQKMEAVGQLTGGIAHDFNNLLQGIVGSLALIEKRVREGRTREVERFLGTAKTAADRAAALTHRLLAFSRRQPLTPLPLKANQLVSSMEDLLRRTLGINIELELVLSGGLWTTLCDHNQLESAILNLAINARDAMPDGGRLTIETTNSHIDFNYTSRDPSLSAGQYVCICVTDNGTGMSPDVASRAFEPFYTTKPIGQGTGLGLSMIYGFAKQSGGAAKIYSEIGTGTCVKIYLPRYRGMTVEDASGEAEDSAPHPALGGERVLVVEDDPIVRELAVSILKDLGYRVLEAGDGPAALEIVDKNRDIDLLISDIGLPGLNGRQVADAVRTILPGLPILFMTGYAENATKGNGFLEPGMHMMTKPFAMEEFGRRVRHIIENGASDDAPAGEKAEISPS